MISIYNPEQALQALKNSDYELVKEMCLAGIQSNPEDISAYNMYAVSELLIGNIDSGVDFLRKSLFLRKNNYDALSNIALTLGKNKSLSVEDANLIVDSVFSICDINNSISSAVEVLGKLGFSKDNDFDWVSLVYERVALPLLEIFSSKNYFEFSLVIESQIYNSYVKSKEDESHFKLAYESISPLMERMGDRRLKIFKKSENFKDKKAKLNKKEVRVAFFIHNSAKLAHVEYLLNFLKEQNKIIDSSFNSVVISLSGTSEETKRICSEHSINLIEIEDYIPNDGLDSRFIWLKKYLYEHDIDTLVIMSVVVYFSYACSLELAPTQIWWSLKYKGFSHKKLSGYLTQSHPEKKLEIDGKVWHGGIHASKSWYEKEKERAALNIRESYPCSTLYGCLAREEKMRNPEFIDSVIDILQSNNTTGFLWTGRSEDEYIKNKIENAGVSDQCYFVGWVDTRLYAQVIDVFLDTFPLGCGFTLLESMAAAKPVVFRETAVNYSSVIRRLNPLLGEDTYINLSSFEASIAKNRSEYVALAVKYHESSTSRYNIGHLNKYLIKEHFSNTERFARIFSDQILDIREGNTKG